MGQTDCLHKIVQNSLFLPNN